MCSGSRHERAQNSRRARAGAARDHAGRRTAQAQNSSRVDGASRSSALHELGPNPRSSRCLRKFSPQHTPSPVGLIAKREARVHAREELQNARRRHVSTRSHCVPRRCIVSSVTCFNPQIRKVSQLSLFDFGKTQPISTPLFCRRGSALSLAPFPATLRHNGWGQPIFQASRKLQRTSKSAPQFSYEDS